MVAVLAHAAFHDVADAELIADLLVVDGFSPVAERGIPRDHIEPAQLRQRGDDVLADAFRKIFLLRLAAEIGKGQHRNRRAIERRELRVQLRELRVQRFAGGVERPERIGMRLATVRRLRLDVADEAKAFSRKGTDHDLILAAVADRLARGVDPARQRGLGDDAAIPHRLDQIVLGDDVVAVFDQVNQEIEHLRLDRHALAAAGQFAKVDIKHMVGKMKLHGFIPVKTSQVISDRQVISGHFVPQEVDRIPRRDRVRNLTEAGLSLKNQSSLKAKSAFGQSL